jgi:hypothetical protein
VSCVFIAGLICSDESCAQELDLVVEELAALEDALCDCGCTLTVLAVSGWTPAHARTLALAA